MAVVYYRTKDGQTDYGFSFEQQLDSTWLVYVASQPSYGNRDTSCTATHRMRDGDGRYYISCGCQLRTEADARKVAALWADLTQEYIRTDASPSIDAAPPASSGGF